jgi:hypothetical protein
MSANENGFGCILNQSLINANKFGGFRVDENCLGASKTNLIRIWRLVDQFSVSDYENGFGCIQNEI